MKLQACVSGYAGAAATVYGFLDDDTDVLVIARIAKELKTERYDGAAVVTNMRSVPSWDAWFTDDDLQAAIAAYAARVSESRLQFTGETAQANPAGALQVAKVDESGRKYEIGDISNRQVATLMLAWYANQSQTIAQTLAFGDQLKHLMSGGILTF